jgi:hypothetical protein
MKAYEALVAWTPIRMTANPTCGKVGVGGLLRGGADWTKPFFFTGGAAYTARRTMRGMDAVAMLFVEFNTMVVRDGIDPKIAHEALLVIDEYAEHISLDTPGAREPDEGL